MNSHNPQTTPDRAPPAPPLPVALERQLAALEEELPLVLKRQWKRAEDGRVHHGTVAIRARELRAALETFREYCRAQGITVKPPRTPL